MASVRSVPIRSAFSSGPSTGSRRPNAALMTLSTVSASQMPRSTSEMASRQSACCNLLPMKPGTSFFTCAGFLPQAAMGAMMGAGAGCFGATIALTRDTLERIGGFGAIADALADDHALGAAVRRIGRRVELSSHLVDNIVVEPSLGALFHHELRWARTIRLVAPAGFVGSIVTYPMVLALLALATDASAAAAAALAASLLCRCLSVRAVDRLLRLPPTPLRLLALRDVLSFTVFVASFFARTVAWRDHTFRVSRNGRLTLDGDSPA